MKVLSKRFLALLITFVMVLSIIPMSTVSVNAAYENTYTNTGNQRIDIVGVAKTQIGNTNGSKYGSGSWCAHFVIWCARQADISSSIIATTGWACADDMKIPYYNRSSYTPKSGDIVFFNWPSTSATWDHVGIVEKVNSDGSVVTIEGNNNGAVRRVTYSSNGSSEYSRLSSIRGYGVPKYNNTTTLTKCTKYPTPIYAQTKATGKTTVYNYPDGSAISNKIYDTDLCTIKTIYTNGWCKVTFPLDAGGTETGYVKTSVFFNPDYTTFKVSASKQITTYPRSNLSGSFGYAASGDTVYIIGHTSSAVQILYPLTGGGYKAGWVPISAVTYTIKYNANGGSGSMSSSTVKYQNSFKLASNTFTKTGHTFSGWNAYRTSDKTWYCTDNGWKTASQITSNNYSKKVYANGLSGTLGKAWMNSGKTNDTLTYYAVWKANTLSVYYNANGASISSDTYKLSSNLVYKKSDSTKYVQTWTYNNKKTNGLVNSGTFGLTKTGHSFKGWGTSASGGTIFDQGNVDLLPATINSNLKTKSCSSTLYAIWEPNTLTVHYKANGGTITSDDYSLVDGYIYKKSNNSKYAHIWEYNSTEPNGLGNASTYGLEREGYTFVGWSSKADGTATVFDQNDLTVVPTDLTTKIKTSNCTLDMYAIWEKDVTEAPTEAPTQEPTDAVPTIIPTITPTDIPSTEPTEKPTQTPTLEPTETPTELTTESPTIEPTVEPTQAPTEIELVIGDIDNDGAITILDASTVQRHLAKLCEFTEIQKIVADTDRDGIISIIDTSLIQRFIAQIIDKF